jgi:hypothetical protein
MSFLFDNQDSPNGLNGCYTYKRKRLYAAAPGRKCVCIKSYRANSSGELSLNKGNIVESKTATIIIVIFEVVFLF